MKKERYTVSVYTENNLGLLTRIATIFLKRHINIESLTVSSTEIDHVSRFIIVVEITQGSRKFSTGIVVDHVQEVLDIAGEQIEEAPQFGSSVETDFILGMGKIGETVKILLDIDRVLAGDDFGRLGGA